MKAVPKVVSAPFLRSSKRAAMLMRQQKIIEKFWKTIYQRPQRELAYDAKVPLNKEKIGRTVIMLITSLV